jgi:hypothetical protein
VSTSTISINIDVVVTVFLHTTEADLVDAVVDAVVDVTGADNVNGAAGVGANNKLYIHVHTPRTQHHKQLNSQCKSLATTAPPGCAVHTSSPVPLIDGGKHSNV